MSEFLYAFKEWAFPAVDIPSIVKATETILRYPMADRDPLSRWSLGRVTLLGDAVHPMYPMGANAILDTVTLAEGLETTGTGDIENALKTYEAARLGPTAEVVYSKRCYGPETILQIVEERISSADDRLEDVITHEEIDEITLAYRKVAGFEVEELNSLDVE